MIERRIEVLGVPIDCITLDQTMGTIETMIDSGRPHLIVTADSSGIVQAQSDRELMDLYRRSDLNTPDSTGVVWAMNRQDANQNERVSGVEIADRICRVSAEKNWSIFLLGSSPGVADEAAANLRKKYPGVNIVGTRHGFFKPEEDMRVAEEVAKFNPDVLLVAMGIPRQEKFILRTMPVIKARVAIGVGGTLDVFSGRAKRAPKLIQKISMEWLWRLILNPSKIAKAKLLPKFVWLNLRDSR